MNTNTLRLPAALVFLVLGLMAGISNASAISVNPPTFTTLIEGSDDIVQGTVIDRECRWVTNQAGYQVIKTYLTVHVNESVKGSTANTVTLVFLGGTVGEQTMEIGGMPTFSKGDRGWFFIRGNGRYLCPLAFAHHGAYLLQKNPNDGSDRIIKLNGQPLTRTTDIGRSHASSAANVTQALTSADFGQAISREMIAIKNREAEAK